MEGENGHSALLTLESTAAMLSERKGLTSQFSFLLAKHFDNSLPLCSPKPCLPLTFTMTKPVNLQAVHM